MGVEEAVGVVHGARSVARPASASPHVSQTVPGKTVDQTGVVLHAVTAHSALSAMLTEFVKTLVPRTVIRQGASAGLMGVAEHVATVE